MCRLSIAAPTMWLSLVFFMQGCGAGPTSVRDACLSPDDTECAQAKLNRPADSNMKTGRTNYPHSLAVAIKNMRRRDPSLPKQVTFFVDKSDRKLTVKLGETVVRSYGVSLGYRPEGHKQKRGDRKTPEGTYYVGYRRTGERGQTRYHRALLISYPRVEDADRGLKSGLINQRQYKKIKNSQERCSAPPQRTKLGGYLLIHGGGGGPGIEDWTWGCIALNDSDVEELYEVARTGCFKGTQTPRTKLVIQP